MSATYLRRLLKSAGKERITIFAAFILIRSSQVNKHPKGQITSAMSLTLYSHNSHSILVLPASFSTDLEHPP